MEHSTAPISPGRGLHSTSSWEKGPDSEEVSALAAAVRKGEARATAAAIAMVESGSSASGDLLRRLFPDTGRASLIGVTGPPGAGKSSVIAALIQRLAANRHRVALLLIDPSSGISGGALLGDRVRLNQALSQSGVFCRSMATRGMLGGLAPAAIGATEVLDAAGYDVILIETCGVGQTETDISEVADLVVLVLQPGAGDNVQAAKAGIMEIADILVVNKSDLPSADATVRQIRGLERRQRGREVIATSATTGVGMDQLTLAIEQAIAGQPRRQAMRRRRAQVEHAVLDLAAALVTRRLAELVRETGEASSLIDRVAARELDPLSAAAALVGKLHADSCPQAE